MKTIVPIEIHCESMVKNIGEFSCQLVVRIYLGPHCDYYIHHKFGRN